jgi:sulfite reductase beta subunit-like hemoprotein
MGDVAFRVRLDELFAAERAVVRAPAPAPAAAPCAARTLKHVRLGVPHGDVPLVALRSLVDAVEACNGEIRIGIEHDLHVFGVAEGALPAETRAWANGGRLVACPGTALCAKAAGPTHVASDVLAPLAASRPELLFAISGCPNGCAHAGIAQVGVIAGSHRVGDERVATYRVLLGGDAGAGPRLAEQNATDVPLEGLAQHVEQAVDSLGLDDVAPSGGDR